MSRTHLILLLFCAALACGVQYNIPFVPRFTNTAEDFSAVASCKGAWIMGGTTEAALMLDRCNATSPDQGGVDDMAFPPAGTCSPGSQGDSINEENDQPAGTASGYWSMQMDEDQGEPCNAYLKGPDGDETEFESNDFSHGCWVKSDYSGGSHRITGFGADGAETTFNLQDTIVNVGSYALMSKAVNKNFFSPDGGGGIPPPADTGPVYAAEVWRFHAMTRVSTGAIILYHSDTDNSEGSLLGCGGDGTNSTQACNAGYTDTMAVAGTSEFQLGESDVNEFEGNLFECWYVAEVLTAEDMCSICRCGFEGQNSGTTFDRAATCNHCTLPGSASTCGDI